MIYQDVDELADVAALNLKVEAIAQNIVETEKAIKVEDSKRREQELRDELKQLRRKRDETWADISRVKEEAFKKLLKEEYGVADNPKFDRAYAIAYEHGHSSGFGDVEGYFMDLVELIR